MTDGDRGAVSETRALFEEFAKHRDPAVRERIVTSHLGLAHHLARRYANRGEPFDDLVQVASIGLVKAVDRFDPERGVQFTTFASHTIIGELRRHFRDKGWGVHAPRRVQELYLAIVRLTESLTHQLARSPTVSEIADASGATNEAVLEALEAGRGYRASSLDSWSSGEQPLARYVGQVDSSLGAVEDRILLAASLADLAPRERRILELRFGQSLSQGDIAKRVGISQMHVSRILRRSLAKLRVAVSEAQEGTRESDSE